MSVRFEPSRSRGQLHTHHRVSTHPFPGFRKEGPLESGLRVMSFEGRPTSWKCKAMGCCWEVQLHNCRPPRDKGAGCARCGQGRNRERNFTIRRETWDRQFELSLVPSAAAPWASCLSIRTRNQMPSWASPGGVGQGAELETLSPLPDSPGFLLPELLLPRSCFPRV